MNLRQLVATVRAVLTVGFFPCSEPTVNSNRELTVLPGLPARRRSLQHTTDR